MNRPPGLSTWSFASPCQGLVLHWSPLQISFHFRNVTSCDPWDSALRPRQSNAKISLPVEVDTGPCGNVHRVIFQDHFGRVESVQPTQLSVWGGGPRKKNGASKAFFTSARIHAQNTTWDPLGNSPRPPSSGSFEKDHKLNFTHLQRINAPTVCSELMLGQCYQPQHIVRHNLDIKDVSKWEGKCCISTFPQRYTRIAPHCITWH